MKHLKWISQIILTFVIGVAMNSCFTSKQMSTAAIPVVANFDLNRYLGTWYEIARLPHSFEKNLIKVTATYTLMPNGKIEVLNQGYKIADGKLKRAKGKAWIPDAKMPANLKVSFFWLFASNYKIIELDQENYSYAVVTSSSKKYLWILSRTPQMDEILLAQLLTFVREKGFDTDKLYRVPQE